MESFGVEKLEKEGFLTLPRNFYKKGWSVFMKGGRLKEGKGTGTTFPTTYIFMLARAVVQRYFCFSF